MIVDEFLHSGDDTLPSRCPDEHVDSINSGARSEQFFHEHLPDESSRSRNKDGATIVKLLDPINYDILFLHDLLNASGVRVNTA